MESLKVTAVKFDSEKKWCIGEVKDRVSIILNDQLIIRGLSVREGVDGMLYVAMPRDLSDGEDMKAIVFPITKELRDHIENKVLEAYKNRSIKNENHSGLRSSDKRNHNMD